VLEEQSKSIMGYYQTKVRRLVYHDGFFILKRLFRTTQTGNITFSYLYSNFQWILTLKRLYQYKFSIYSVLFQYDNQCHESKGWGREVNDQPKLGRLVCEPGEKGLYSGH
jgi:hypothetical protein